MTPEQESNDAWRFKVLLVSGWATVLLYLLMLVFYVESCRQQDLKDVKRWIESVRCPCSMTPSQQHNNQQVHVERPKTFEDMTWDLVKIREQNKSTNQPVKESDP